MSSFLTLIETAFNISPSFKFFFSFESPLSSQAFSLFVSVSHISHSV